MKALFKMKIKTVLMIENQKNSFIFLLGGYGHQSWLNASQIQVGNQSKSSQKASQIQQYEDFTPPRSQTGRDHSHFKRVRK